MKTFGFAIPETNVSKAFNFLIGEGANKRFTIVVGFTQGIDGKNGLVYLWQPFGRSFVWRT